MVSNSDKSKFIETRYHNRFATIPYDAVLDKKIEVIYPMNWERTRCYIVERERLKSLIDDGKIKVTTILDGDNKRIKFIKEMHYKNYFKMALVSEVR